MKKETISRVAIGTVGVIAGLGAGLAGIASAQSIGTAPSASSTAPGMHRGMRGMMENDGKHFAGTIAAISGSTFTLTGMNGTTYTVDAASAKVTDGPQNNDSGTGSLASLTASEKVMVEGTLSGSTITATEIHTGMPAGRGGMKGEHGRGVMGQVTAVSGTTITVSGKDGKTYTVDAGSATINKMVTISASDVKVGDTLGIEGTLSGTNVTARHIMDGIPAIGKAPKQQ